MQSGTTTTCVQFVGISTAGDKRAKRNGARSHHGRTNFRIFAVNELVAQHRTARPSPDLAITEYVFAIISIE